MLLPLHLKKGTYHTLKDNQMKGPTVALSPVGNTETNKQTTALAPEKKSNCGKCKNCKCQLSTPNVFPVGKDKKA